MRSYQVPRKPNTESIIFGYFLSYRSHRISICLLYTKISSRAHTHFKNIIKTSINQRENVLLKKLSNINLNKIKLFKAYAFSYNKSAITIQENSNFIPFSGREASQKKNYLYICKKKNKQIKFRVYMFL